MSQIVKPTTLIAGNPIWSPTAWRSNAVQGADDEGILLTRASAANYCANAFTVEMMYRIHRAIDASTPTIYWLTGVWKSAGTWFAWELRYEYNGGAPRFKLTLRYADLAWMLAQAAWSYTLVAEKQYHIALSWDTATSDVTNAKFYINGADQGVPTVLADSGGSNTKQIHASAEWTVGCYGQTDDSVLVATAQDDYDIGHHRYWNYVRTQAEILANMHTRYPDVSRGPAHGLHFLEVDYLNKYTGGGSYPNGASAGAAANFTGKPWRKY